MGKSYMNREWKHKDNSTASFYHDFNGPLAFTVEMGAESCPSFLHDISLICALAELSS